KHVPGHHVGTGPRSSTDRADRAPPALSLKLGDVAQCDKQWRFAVQLSQRLLRYISRGKGKEATRIHFAAIVYEHESFPVIYAARRVRNRGCLGQPAARL